MQAPHPPPLSNKPGKGEAKKAKSQHKKTTESTSQKTILGILKELGFSDRKLANCLFQQKVRGVSIDFWINYDQDRPLLSDFPAVISCFFTKSRLGEGPFNPIEKGFI